MAATKVIIDTDAGTDDALALFMALEAHKRGCLEVLAITTVQGNTSLHNVNNNVLRILRTANLLEIPVYSGARQSLVHPWTFDEQPYHGKDGFGEADLPPQPPAATLLQPRHAVWALVQLVVQHSGEVVMVALGPLTNLALALRLDPAFTSHLAALYVMGGNTVTVGKGSITGSVEFNFRCDADAAFVVVGESSVPIHLTAWEICNKAGAFPLSVRDELGSTQTAAADLMNKIEAQAMQTLTVEGEDWVTCDQLAMAWVIDDAKMKKLQSKHEKNGPNRAGFLEQGGKPLVTATRTAMLLWTPITCAPFFLQSLHLYILPPPPQGRSSRGQMVIDHDDQLSRRPNMVLMEAVDVDIYVKYLSMAFGADI
ncbi:Inosine-uridine preferring nucleoside hydrolase [Chionoecetes opilio]|uniref:Inosine-uridine preferring nucleoside hydrolase n=1 Tax=Chionoecetes opilio TaxID=41210 RepID=A0A8J4Y5A7_CHIOP|nr:Inosine-uridine preferring nucleoside hydrolase [Chionoecetes opilio]